MRRKPTLVVLAAGMGSRYGGLKQIDPVGENGEIIIDYSVFDAVRAGFDRVVFIINRALREEFDEVIGKALSKHVETAYVYQDMEAMLPSGAVIPEGRIKPWGTGQALLCCREILKEPFAVINADDYYGSSAFVQMYAWLNQCDPNAAHFSMVGYVLKNTLTDHGSVARGICEIVQAELTGIVERTMIVKTAEGASFSEDGGESFAPISPDSVVSMNFWGLTPAVFPYLERQFNAFIQEEVAQNPLKAEIYIPNVIGDMIQKKQATVQMMQSADHWHGVTYKEDKPKVVQAMRALTRRGVYPKKLWG